MTQPPLRPPTTKAAFKTPGQTATASAPSSSSRGMALSDTPMILLSTAAASLEWRAASAPLSLTIWADAGTKHRHRAASAARPNVRIPFDEINITSLLHYQAFG